MRPLYVYDNWSSYDELSDSKELTEELALFELDQVLRLRSLGVRIDAYLMDACWYAEESAYRTWRADRWPQGPDRWFSKCQESGLKTGLWFPANTCFQMKPPDSWRSSLADDKWGFSCFEGGFLDGLADALEYWYSRGVRVFKFDFAEFGAASHQSRLRLLPSEIRQKNVRAYRSMLRRFRKTRPDVVLTAYNGFEESEFMTWTDRPVRRLLDPAWLTVFDSIYCGDPRPADVPSPNFWRSLDVYADAMVYFVHKGGLPLKRIDSCSFMIGVTGTCYRRGKANWFPSLVLSLARGGRVHMSLGNLERISDDEASYWAAAQRFYETAGNPEMFGGNPGYGESYGYLARAAGRLVATVVNPSLAAQVLALPNGYQYHAAFVDGQLEIGSGSVELGPGAVAVLSTHSKDLLAGPEPEEPGAKHVSEISVQWKADGRRASAAIFGAEGYDLHLVFQQKDANGLVVRTSGGSPPKGVAMPKLLRIEATQNGLPLIVERQDDREIWSGMSWAYGIVRKVLPGVVHVTMSSSDDRVSRIEPRALVS